jgi:hypothetical protein
MKIQTSELIGPALDWAVATAVGCAAQVLPIRSNSRIVGHRVYLDPAERDEFGMVEFDPSITWSQGGPIIEREGISTRQAHDSTWRADYSEAKLKPDGSAYAYLQNRGPTPLVAAMRCFVSCRLGSEVDIPDELSTVVLKHEGFANSTTETNS